jgi:hypothetical protein
MKKMMMTASMVFVCVMVFAQRSNVHFGLKAGLNLASLNVENGTDYSAKAFPHVGALAHIHLSPHFALQPEIYFSGQGGKDGNTSINLAYLDIPLLFQYMTGDGFRLYTGPQLGALLKAKFKDGNIEEDIKDQLKTADVSWAFGASYLFPGSGFGIDARYNLGLSNINEPLPNVQNRVFAIGLFYQFINDHPATRHRR